MPIVPCGLTFFGRYLEDPLRCQCISLLLDRHLKSCGELFMKKIVTLIVSGAALAIAANAPARADAVDMSTVTCGQLMTMPAEGVSFMLTWVQGYLAGTDDEL